MPGGDGTGPGSMGPMTGRAAGYCAGYPVAGFMNPIPGCGPGGWGHGWGRGRGRRHRFRGGGWGHWSGFPSYAPAYGVREGEVTPQQELDALKEQAEYLQDALGGVRQRIEELETEAKKKK